MIISSLEPRDVILLTRQPIDRLAQQRAVMGAYAAFYNQRGGRVEIEIKEDKQGVGMTKRSKKRFEAQQMVVLLVSGHVLCSAEHNTCYVQFRIM